MTQQRLILIDDHVVVRQALRFLFENAGLEVVGEASCAADALAVVQEVACDVVLLDIGLPDKDGAWLTGEIRRRSARLPILVLTAHDDERLVRAALSAGANGYVVKSASRDELLTAVETVGKGSTYLHASIAATVLGGLEPLGNGQQLNEDEMRVLRMVADGHSNREIAEAMHLSVSSIKARLAALFERFAVDTRTGLVAEAVRRNMLER